jgi:hypothetical protein
MDAHKLQLKIFVTPESARALDGVAGREAFVPVFHRWIKEHVLPELLIDVASYVHVPEGPSIALIGHGSDYFIDDGAGRLGFLHSRKRAGLAADVRLEDLARRTLHAARLLESDLNLTPRVKFASNELLFRVNDRLAAPASDTTFAALRPELEALATRLYGAGSFELTRVGGPKDLFAVRILGTSGTVPLATLLERAGGPPVADGSLVAA